MKPLAHILLTITWFSSAAMVGTSYASTATIDFNDNTAGPLGDPADGLGQSGGSGFAAVSTWDTTDTISVIAGDLAAPAATNFAVAQSGTPQSIAGTATGGAHTTRALEEPLAGTIWFAFLLRQPTAASRGGLTFNQTGGAPSDPRVVATGTELRLGLATLQGAGEGAVGALTIGQTALILGRLVTDPAGDEVLDVWIDPDVSGGVASLPAPSTTLVQDAPALDGGLGRVGLQSYSTDTMGGILDQLRISDAINAFDVVVSDAAPIVDDPDLVVAPPGNPFAGLAPTTDDPPVTADLTLSNTGAANTLTIADTTAITGADATNFSILTPLPIDILPGGDATFQVQFDSGGAPGDFTAALEIGSNDTSNPVVVVPLAVSVSALNTDLLLNGDFEASDAELESWAQQGGGIATVAEGIAPGSTNSAALSGGVSLSQNVAGLDEWFCDFYFQAPDTVERAFNVLVFSSLGNVNLRFQGSADGAAQTWNAFDNSGVGDLWGPALALPAVQPGATYFMRILGRDWGGAAPEYDLHLSDPGGSALVHSLEGLTRFQNSAPTSAPTFIRFSTEFGNAPGFVVDDVRFGNGTPLPDSELAITGIEHDDEADTTTIHFTAVPGVTYFVYASDDLQNWEERADLIANSAEETFSENGISEPHRYYRIADFPLE